MIKRFLLLIFTMCLFYGVEAQSFGLRAGLNYTQFSGALEQGVGEKYSLSDGFHFGINYAYNFADDFSVKGEVVYTQTGSKYNYNGESFYKVPLGSAFLYEKGNSTIEMKISNAYVSFPVTLNWMASKKIEVSAGFYASMLIGPKGSGTIKFVSSKRPDSLFFIQSLIHNYNSDVAGGIATSQVGAAVFVNGATIVTLARDAGAYYNYLSTEKEANLYKPYDIGITGGISYFINRGFYFGLRYDFGLIDITRNNVDHLRKTYDTENSSFLFSKDYDRNVGIQASFGFRF